MWFGANPRGRRPCTTAIQNAINVGVGVEFPEGIFVTSEITIPRACAATKISGSGFYLWATASSHDKGTVIKAERSGQHSLFTLEDGADNVTFADIRLDGDDKSSMCVDGSFGTFLTMENVGVYGSEEFGVFSRQGLGRYTRCYFRNNGVGLHLHADSSVESCEFTGGTEPLIIAAGGCRLSNIWSHNGSVSCLTLTPIDDDKPHINTSLVNLYCGETVSTRGNAPIILIQGTTAQKVQQVHLANSHFVCASPPDKINTVLQIYKAIDVTIANLVVLGNSPATSKLHLAHVIVASQVSNLNVLGGVFRNVALNPIVLKQECWNVTINGVQFSEFATRARNGSTKAAAVLITDNLNYGQILNCSFDAPSDSVVPYPIEGGDAHKWLVGSNLVRLKSNKYWQPSVGEPSGSYQRMGEPYLNHGALRITDPSWNALQPAAGTAFALGRYSLWVDANGRLRIKDGAPAFDEDGTIVGTQS